MKPVFNTWTVVVVGRWNVSIFNPDWLGKNLFDNKELLVDFPMEPGLPLPHHRGQRVVDSPRRSHNPWGKGESRRISSPCGGSRN